MVSFSLFFFVCFMCSVFIFAIFKSNTFIFYILAQTLSHWVKKYGWKEDGQVVFIASQDENIKTKNITEKIDFENVGALMSACQR